jgi:hypothetical protein
VEESRHDPPKATTVPVVMVGVVVVPMWLVVVVVVGLVLVVVLVVVMCHRRPSTIPSHASR